MRQRTEKPTVTSPLFRQIVDDLRREIVGGALSEHAPLPSERAIAELHGVSRMTARRALEAVEAEGLAYSEARRGRFVSPQRINYSVNSMVSFIADAKADGIDLDVELVDSDEIEADGKLCGILGVALGTGLHKCTRLFRSRGHAIFLETEFTNLEHRAELLVRDPLLSATLLEQRFSPLGHSADIVVRMRALLAHEAPLLGLVPHQSVIELEQVIRDAAGEPFCLSMQIWRGELAEFSAQAIVKQ